MKKPILILIILFLGLIGCDKTENPIPPVFGDLNWSLYPGDSNNYLALYSFEDPSSNWSTNMNTKTHILLEDYTGHKCGSCPAAAEDALLLENDSSLGVIVVSIHACDVDAFQHLDSAMGFITDFTTNAGDVYIVDMPGFPANPIGTINRKPNPLDPENDVWFATAEWPTYVNQEQNSDLLANIQLQSNYFPSTNGLFIHVESEFKSNLSGDYNLIIYLVRESVIASQFIGGTTNLIDPNYNHHSVLSDNVNGTWGTLLSSGDVSSGTKFYNDYSIELPDPNFDSTYDISNLSLIAYICERNSFEVIQVTKLELD